MNITHKTSQPENPKTDPIAKAVLGGAWVHAFECVMSAARAAVRREANRAAVFLEDVDAQCRQLAERLAVDLPATPDPIGFDRPTNIYVVTEVYPTGGHRNLLGQIIAAYPDERHIVLFTGALENTRAYSLDMVTKAGGFAIYPDAALDHGDRLLWLREKLAAYTARRLFLLHHPEDAIAAVAISEFAGRYGRRAYVVHHADTVASLGVDLPEATHLAIRPEQSRKILEQRPDYAVYLLPLAYAPELLKPSKTPDDEALLRPILMKPSLNTATCGGEHKFLMDGPLGLPEIFVRILETTRGRHFHIGPLAETAKADILNALEDAGISTARLVLINNVPSVARALFNNKVDLFITSFPVGGGLTVIEAASQGLPIVVYGGASDEAGRYVSGMTHAPDEALAWRTPEELEEALNLYWRKGGIRRFESMSRASRRWFTTRHSWPRFRRRLHAIVALSEGRRHAWVAPNRHRIAQAMVDADYYLQKNSGVAKAKLEPASHFLSHGEKELRKPNALFDPAFYLSQLPDAELRKAKPAPAAHYVTRGEALGYRPHPMFDPAFCRKSFEAAGLWEEESGDAIADCVLLRYLRASRLVAPHMFFDPLHYDRQATLVPEGQSLLAHFLETGGDEGLSPHPLLSITKNFNWETGPQNIILNYLTQPKPHADEPKASRLFGLEGDRETWVTHYANAAPNLLWAHLIEGNQGDRDPHILISVRHVERMRPGTLVSATAIIRLLAVNRLGVDTHPLVDGRYILSLAPFASTFLVSLTQYFLEYGVRHNIDPHPFFSTRYYLYRNADLKASKINPLVHFLRHGQYEGRQPHPAFDSKAYRQRWLKDAGRGSPLLHYVGRGMALFRPALPLDPVSSNLTQKTAVGLFEIGSERAAGDLLAAAIHPDTMAPHPTLLTETRSYLTDASDADQTTELYPAETVFLDRPSVVAQTHIAPPIGEYLAPAATASLYSDAVLVPGNDGFIAASGRWIDHGLFGFDNTDMQVKQNGAVVSVSNGKVLLRRYASHTSLPVGILASGTYSHNYFHFLLEILPRVLLAADIAPAGTPILADDGMPNQHYQALRLYLPTHPILRLTRHSSVKVSRLYVGSMPNSIQDAFTHAMPPADAIRLHPAIIRRLARTGRALSATDIGQRLYLHRVSKTRSLLNATEISEALVARDFRLVRCETLTFVQQIGLFSATPGDIVAQSGGHLANILFAPKGTRVFALFSNAPGTNFYLWSALGALLEHEVINIVGWRIVGSAPGHLPKAHEAFTLPPSLLTPFFPKSPGAVRNADPLGEARALLRDLYAANDQADTLTGAWNLRARSTPEGFERAMIRMRQRLRELLYTLPDDGIADLLQHPFFKDFSRNTRSGYVALQDHDAAELETLSEIESYFQRLSTDALSSTDIRRQDFLETAEQTDGFDRMLALAIIYIPAWKLPLVSNLTHVPPARQELYLNWVSVPPYLFRDGDDAGYVAFTERLLNWMSHHLGPDKPLEIRKRIMKTASQLDLGQLLLVDEPVCGTLVARSHLLEHIAVRDNAALRTRARPDDMSQGRIRIGILCRTFACGPDSEAVVACFNMFDKARYEIFAYSVGFQDRVVAEDEEFDRVFDATIDHRRIVARGAHDIREQLLADDLDVFLYANATTFGVRELECALYHRVAPVQMTLNSHLPMPPGFPSFDYYLTGRSDDPDTDIADGDYPERILRVEGSVINYLNSLKPRQTPSFGRAALGLSEDDFVMMNGGSSQKLRTECLRTMMRAVSAVPNGKLLLAPYNPGWAARSQAFAFNRQLSEAAEAEGVSMDRIIVMGELSVAEAEAAVALSDIYLSSFPHGGATMTHLALIYGTPPVVLRRRSTRAIDQFLVSALKFDRMLVSTPQEYIDLVVELAQNPDGLQKLSEAMKTAARNPVFVANPDFSLTMQATIERVLATARDSIWVSERTTKTAAVSPCHSETG